MTGKELRNLQEAYLDVYYDLDELYKGKHGQSETEYMDSRSTGGKMVSGDSKHSGASFSHRSFRGVGKPAKPGQRQQDQGRMDTATRADIQYRKKLLKKENYDVYDVILSHLLDEGYADTLEAAEKIMVNMSEEWREDIVEGALENVATGAGRIVGGVQRTASNLARRFEAGRQSGLGMMHDRAGGMVPASSVRPSTAGMMHDRAGGMVPVSTKPSPKTTSDGGLSRFERIRRNAAAGSVTDKNLLSRFSPSNPDGR